MLYMELQKSYYKIQPNLLLFAFLILSIVNCNDTYACAMHACVG